jgi:phthalate 4,5-dioxygenase reductase subunit
MSLDPDSREMALTVRKKSEIADGVFLFELRSPAGADLPAFKPGSHITVTAPSGQKRRYSLCTSSPSSRRPRAVAAH